MNLHEGIAAQGLALPAAVEEKMMAYLALLTKWNRVYNLTAIRDPEQMVTHHLLDSLAVLPHLGDIRTMVDVGSGGGLPGLALAISQPNLQITSVEASQKKAVFQKQVKIELGLSNVSIHCGRIELLAGTFDAAISRAFADLSDFIRLAGHLTSRLLAMKGAYPQAEIDHLPADWRLANSIKLTVPGLEVERHLIVLEKT
jgi:16S rRNA (guanine527-N7)-methyltransferase